MSKARIIPTKDGERLVFYPRLGTNIDQALKDMGLPPTMGDDAKVQALAWEPSYKRQQDALEAAKAASEAQAQQNTRTHDAVQALLDQLKPNPKYTPAIQALLGTTPVTHDPAARAGADQPVIAHTLTAGHPDLKCVKHHHAQVKILCQRGAEPSASVLAVLTHFHYLDTRPNLDPTRPEIRTYTFVYLDHDQETGQYSDPVNVTVPPQP